MWGRNGRFVGRTLTVSLCQDAPPIEHRPRRGCGMNRLAQLKESIMRLALIALLLPLALAGCLSFSSSDPSPPASNTTIVTPSQ
jgi:hypothetical protein